MRLGVLFSGGKDSTLALQIAADKEEVACLITLVSKNPESYMFHTPNIDMTVLQSEALGLPLVSLATLGQKEAELVDLENAIAKAKKEFNLDGVVTGAVESVYQASRMQRICHSLDLWSFNPLWKHDQKSLLESLLKEHYQVIISGVFAYPLDEKWLGKQLNAQMILRLVELQGQFGISPSGEGGEIETTVLDAPMFRKRIEVVDSLISARGNSGTYLIKKAKLVPK
jgi:ABC transporter with metal-binding/Fe-S-binding domain ATP-binding protein